MTNAVIDAAETQSRLAGMEWLAIRDLYIANYQREVYEDRIRKRVKNFAIDKVAGIAVNLRDDGRYFLMDGQHRVEAAKRLEIPALPCLVYVGLTESQEADMRIALNDRKADNARDIFKLRLAAHDADALEIKSICLQNNLQLVLTGKGGLSNPREIGCISALETVYRIGGTERLSRVLSISVAAWPDDEKGREAAIVRGLSAFLAVYPDADDKRLIHSLHQHGATALRDAGRRRQRDFYEQGHLATHLSVSIWTFYNKYKRTQKLEWRFQHG